jgi:serine/threonine protein kinase
MSTEDRTPLKTQTLEIAAFAPGTLFAGRYKILEELGQGGMGVVQKAWDTRLEREVALKFLLPELASHPELKAPFLREARTAAALDHPHICPVFEVDEAEGRIFISIAFIAGESLMDRIGRGLLDPLPALDIIRQIAEGLKAAHERGIIHRDIKPSNIMVTPDGQARITDFGLAKTSGGLFLTRVGTTIGTIAYMSPEQARGEDVDRRTDLWSLGVVLYECLTGRLPFKGEHEQVLLHGILHKRPVPLSEAGRVFPREVENIVHRAL